MVKKTSILPSGMGKGNVTFGEVSGGLKREAETERPFTKVNFILMGCCLCLIILGFCLMAGPGSSLENGYNPDIFSTRRIVVGPLFAFLGFLCMSFAILWHPQANKHKAKDVAEAEK